ncbi:MAG: hypothetical protein WBA37_10045, partial [Xanthobacteraceae bacterium]
VLGRAYERFSLLIESEAKLSQDDIQTDHDPQRLSSHTGYFVWRTLCGAEGEVSYGTVAFVIAMHPADELRQACAKSAT